MATYTVGSGGDYADLATIAASGALANGDFIQLMSGYNVDQQIVFAGLDNVTVTGDVNNPAGYVVTFSNVTSIPAARTWTSTNCSNWTYQGFTLKYTTSYNSNSGAWYGSGTTSGNLFQDLVVYTNGHHGFFSIGDNSVLKRCHMTSIVMSGGQAGYLLYTNADNVVVESCLVVGASSYGLYIGGDDAVVRNCTIYNGNTSSINTAYPRGGYLAGANATLSNTVCDMTNAGATGSSSGIILGDAATATANNCVLFGSTYGDNSDLNGHASATTSNVTLSSGIGANNTMVDPANGDYTPANPGLLYHAGNWNTDQYGRADVLRNGTFAGSPSIGAYEYQGAAHGSGTTYSIGTGGDYATVQTCVAAGVIAHGDTLQLVSGYSVDEQISITNWRNVTLVGDVTNPANYTVQFTNPDPGGAAGAATIVGANHYGVHLKGFTLKFLGLNTSSSAAYRGGYSGKGNTLFEDMIVVAGSYYGLSAPGSGSVFRRCRVSSPLGVATTYGLHDSAHVCIVAESCEVTNFRSSNIYLGGEGIIIRNCTAWNHQTGAGISSFYRGIIVDKGGVDVINTVVGMGGTPGEGFTTSWGIQIPDLEPDTRLIDCVFFGHTADLFPATLANPLKQSVKLTADVSSAAVVFDDVATLDLSPFTGTGNILYKKGNEIWAVALDVNYVAFNDPPSIGAIEDPEPSAFNSVLKSMGGGLINSPFTLTP